ncbi:MAG: hypothetical protein ACREFR_02100 [Limisphaerales bacterium]
MRLFNGYDDRRLAAVTAARRQMNMNCLEVKVVSPQEIALNGSGPAIFTEQLSCFSVRVPVGFLKNWKERNGNREAQVWLLKRDGTMVPRTAPPFLFAVGAAGDHARDYQFHSFSKVLADELASVVVCYHGRLYCHEIQTSQRVVTLRRPLRGYGGPASPPAKGGPSRGNCRSGG